MPDLPMGQKSIGRPLYERLALLLKDNHERGLQRREMQLFHDRFPNGVKINQYTKYDSLCNTYDSFSQVIETKNYKDYYYRFDAFPTTSHRRMNLTYFGLHIRPVGSARLDEGTFCNVCLNGIIQHPGFRSFVGDPFFDPFPIPVYYRFVKKMYQIASLDQAEFEDAVKNLISSPLPFQNVEDLSCLPVCCGIYVLVLDEYRQCYIGKSNDIRRRITQHWSKNDGVSGYGINTFRAIDTTRIYILTLEERAYINHIDELEFKLIERMNEKFLLNIMPGGDWIGDIHDPTSIYM